MHYQGSEIRFNDKRHKQDREAKRIWRSENRDKNRAQKRANYQKHKERYKKEAIEKRFNITSTQYNEIFAAQGGSCAVCGAHQSTLSRALAVDHDHSCCPGRTSCGKCIRGLLCDNCNFSIGHAKESADILEKAAQYLRKK